MLLNADLRERMLDDLLAAERNFRDLAEKRVRALTGVLTELAYRLAGERLEQARLLDPSAPGNWRPEDWRSFFSDLPVQGADGWGRKAEDGKEIALQNRIAVLERELAQARQEARSPARSQPTMPKPEPEDTGGRLAGFVLPKIPKAFEHRWQVRSENISKADAELNSRRRGMVLKCLADGLNVQIEIGKYIGDATAAQYRSGSIRRVFDALEESGLIIRQTLSLQVTGNTLTRLAVARLSAEGKQLCAALGWQVLESDWERLIRLHEGENQEGHTLAALLFGAVARLQGWVVEMLPEVPGNARPDLKISQETQGLYIEVETGTRLHDENTKWRMNAEMNNGRIALVARNVQERAILIADCRHIAEHGFATDIESIISSKFVEESARLWAEEW